MGPRRLYRSRTERQIAGVAGGIGNYLDVDPTVIRVLWIISVFFVGMGILLYVILAFVVPLEPLPAPAGQGTPAAYVPAAATPPPASQPPAVTPASEATTAENPASQTDGS